MPFDGSWDLTWGSCQPGVGEDITLGYYDNDLARTVTQAGAVTSYGLDLTGRRFTSTAQPVTGPPTTSPTVRHYADSSDNPAWTDITTGTGTVTTRYAEGLTGDLGVTIAADGTCNLSLANTHGDVVTTVTISAGQAPTVNATAISGWSDSTEYGTPTDAAATAAVAGPIGYGWLGAKQRPTTAESAGLTLMGDRLYNPTRGAFTSLDPEPGGNTTAYTYPQDPINGYDLNGRWWGSSAWNATASWGRSHAKQLNFAGRALGWVSTAASFCPLAQCQAEEVGLLAIWLAYVAAAWLRR